MERVVTEVIFGNTPEEFLIAFQNIIAQGFRLSSVSPTFGFGGWTAEVSRTYNVKEKRRVENQIKLPIRDSDYEKTELEMAYWEDLTAIAKHLGIPRRNRAQLVKDILRKQKEKS